MQTLSSHTNLTYFKYILSTFSGEIPVPEYMTYLHDDCEMKMDNIPPIEDNLEEAIKIVGTIDSTVRCLVITILGSSNGQTLWPDNVVTFYNDSTGIYKQTAFAVNSRKSTELIDEESYFELTLVADIPLSWNELLELIQHYNELDLPGTTEILFMNEDLNIWRYHEQHLND